MEEEEGPGPAKRARANALPAGNTASAHSPLQPGDMGLPEAGLDMDMPAFDDAPLPDGLPLDGLDDDIEQCVSLGILLSCNPAPVQERSGEGTQSMVPD